MSTQAGTIVASQVRTGGLPDAFDSSLLDVLPQSVASLAGQQQGTLEFAVDASLAQALRNAQAADATDTPCRLATALALVEARLSGADDVTVRVVGADGTRQARIRVDGPLSSLRSCIAQASLVDGEAAPVVWASVAEGQAHDGAASSWCLRLGSEPVLEVVFRSPLSLAAATLLAGCVLRALEATVASPELSCDAVDVVDPDERERQLREWSTAPAARTRDGTVHDRFAQVCAQTPDAMAVVDSRSSLTYAELDRRAGSLASRLRSAGITTGQVVGMAVPRSVDSIVALLGVLKCGAAYLPLELSLPAERVAFMLADAKVDAVVVADTTVLPLPDGVARVPVDGDEPAWDGDCGTDADSLAYVLFTSGSTGTPKGVEVRHRSLLRRAHGVDYMALDAQTRLMHAAPLGFDISGLEIWGALLNGGVVVVNEEAVPSIAGLARTIKQHAPNAGVMAVALFNAVVDESPELFVDFRDLLIGGESLSADHVRRMQPLAPSLRIGNGYGPTECTILCTQYPIPALTADVSSIPIGRPVEDTSVYVLNPRRQLVPVGVIGELCVGGAGVARGYLNRPELNAERFVPDPFGAAGEVLYRTGDHVRYRADGLLEFVGRTDAQVKIRGYRIELTEIEAVLARHPSVASCVVEARADSPGEKRLVAYYVAAPTGDGATPQQLRAHLAASLPHFMVPTRYVGLDELPLTANAKIDRRALPAPDRRRPELTCDYAPPATPLEARICEAFGALLDIEGVGRLDNFFELGGSSLLAVRLAEQIRNEGWQDAAAAATTRVAATTIFQHPTVAALAAAIDGRERAQLQPAAKARALNRSEPIAVIAMAGRFPGADDVEGFWDNLLQGRDSISKFRIDELDPAVSAAERSDPAYVAARGVIDGVEMFDAAFFGIGPREAELMDPQQRIFLELCWECLERGGHAPDTTTVPVGVFAGMNNATYFQRHASAHPELINRVGALQVMLGNEKDYIATRVAHKLNLNGPAISLNTACSTSLVAICQAVDSLQSGLCDMALAGGIAVTCPPRSGYLYQEGSMLSPDGHTRTFDANAKGTVFGDGATVVLLKRLSDAIADGNHVFAVIRGAALNNDGSNRASFTAPSSEGQAAVIAMAHDRAGIDPRSISYVEAHGTATPLGDPIEIEGLTRAFRRGTADTGFCRIGSLKSNVGHLVTAAGAAGVIKTALALDEKRIPASIHFDSANPTIDFASTPFVVNAQLSPWHSDSGPRRAGVSSFGLGGTNAHVVMEEAPAQEPSSPASGSQLLVLSARTPAALGAAVTRLADHLQANPHENLADVAWTLAVGRKSFSHRIAVVADDIEGAIRALRDPDTQAEAARSRPARASEVVFMFPGQGATYPGMGRSLYEHEPAFRDALDECAVIARDALGFDLREAMFDADEQRLLPTSVMQPATFAIEYSLARTWMSQGVMPSAMIGHSVGEFVAATLAGVFTLSDALQLVARRGALMQAQPQGAMLSVRLPADSLRSRLPEGVSLAAENSPLASVVAGPGDAVARFQAQLEAEGVACRALRTSHAFHSAMMEAVVAPFREAVAAVPMNAPSLPLVSTVTGAWLDADTATSPDYWARHLREPVSFSPALQTLLDVPTRVLLEVGPRTTLNALARQQPAVQKQRMATISTLSDSPDNELRDLCAASGRLWSQGVAIDPASFDRRERRIRLRLPTYPFERQRYWVEAVTHATSNVIPHPAIATTPKLEPVMPQSALPAAPAPAQPEAGSARRDRLIGQLRGLFENVAGFDMADADTDTNFIELGLDSLMLTQVALQLQKTFPVAIGFRQLMGDCSSLDRLASAIDAQLPPDEVAAPVAPPQAPVQAAPPVMQAPVAAFAAAAPMAMPVLDAGNDFTRQVISQQMQLMSQQLALLSGGAVAAPVAVSAPVQAPSPAPIVAAPVAALVAATPAAAAQPAAAADAGDEDVAAPQIKYDIKKAFGAIARIDNNAQFELNPQQRRKLDAFIDRYIARTGKSKDYTQAHRGHLADPRVVNGFRPLVKEIVYQIVVERSKGSHVQDLDGNDYVDALNGFGMSLFGWQPDFVLDAVRRQLDQGYEIGPQHPVAGEVAQLICEVTGHERAALCNTGSEAVLGALRIARTVTARSTVVLFTGSYHGIVDEVIVRGTKSLRAVPAAPGILRNTSENVLVLDYGTPESLEIIRSRASEIAAILIEPVQSRRLDFRPVEFLKDLRQITSDNGALLIFDEVVTGFRANPGGVQSIFGIKADLATYGKVIGGGFPIGVIAGKREYMDALDGGHWQYGDDSVPTVGVTYFAGTFVRHPLALVAAKAVLEHFKREGGALQQGLNARTEAMVADINAFCADAGAPVSVKQFASVWKTHFHENHPLQDLLFALMRSRGIHILDNFPCFLTTAHSDEDIAKIATAFKESVVEMQDMEFLPRNSATPRTVMDASKPVVPGARIGREPDGTPAWFVPNPEQPGKYMKVSA
ncbi:amino acid adenylation domain-containing protein [Lysobacter arenosi]|uniref:Amino acid adenylation domain-containing protein n=1 Tax=Lysobacter arenosi TaxID=2795387 RepID=A0ABX7RBG0_9GAMM|nr:polyketide synthase [Lysobacter arenosi]QSX75472.1 amino acid adenylation domain-containing protein [Lysobacter arenosi]